MRDREGRLPGTFRTALRAPFIEDHAMARRIGPGFGCLAPWLLGTCCLLIGACSAPDRAPAGVVPALAGTDIGQLAALAGGDDHELKIFGAPRINTACQIGGELHFRPADIGRRQRIIDAFIGNTRPSQASMRRANSTIR